MSRGDTLTIKEKEEIANIIENFDINLGKKNTKIMLSLLDKAEEMGKRQGFSNAQGEVLEKIDELKCSCELCAFGDECIKEEKLIKVSELKASLFTPQTDVKEKGYGRSYGRPSPQENHIQQIEDGHSKSSKDSTPSASSSDSADSTSQEKNIFDKIEKRLLRAFATRHRIHLELKKRVRVQEVIKSVLKEMKNEL